MDQVDEVKQKTDIVSVIGERVKLNKAGKNFKGLCPFHSEKTPSFIVSPELQIYKCFGCNEFGDVISFLQKFDGMEFYEALKYLADKAGVKLKPIAGANIGQKEKLYELNKLVARFYSYFLLEKTLGRKALSYLSEDRGLKMETIKHFNLGFSPDDSRILVNFLIGKKKYKKEDLVSSGIFYGSRAGLQDRFRGRVIFPLFDHRGNVVGFAGRLMPGAKLDLAKYINTPETPIYHKSSILFGMNITKDEIKKLREAIIVEGELDMISSWQAGVGNVVAIKGSSLTEEQVRLISRFADKITLSLDSDTAGSAASKRGIGVAMREGLEIRVCEHGDYKDPDEIARKNPELYKKNIKNAVGAWEYLINLPFKKYDLSTSMGSAKISKEIISVLTSIPDKIVQAKFVESAAKKLQIPSSAIYEELSGVKEEKADKKNKTEVQVRSRRELIEEELLATVLAEDPKILSKKSVKSLFVTSFYIKLIDEILKHIKDGDFDLKTFSKVVSPELFRGFSELILQSDMDGKKSDEAKKNIESLVKEIKTLNLKEKLATISHNIRKFESEGDTKKLREAESQFSLVSRDLNNLKKESI